MRVRSSVRRLAAEQRWARIRALLALNVVALSSMYLSGQWDAAEHAKGAVDRFWYPPHFGIYFALLAAAVLAGLGLALLLQVPGRTTTKLRANAALTFVVGANVLNVTGAPFDAWWHATFGIDLTVWSPPHLHILLGTMLAGLASAVYFLDSAATEAPLRWLRVHGRRDALLALSLLLVWLMSSYLFLEYEAGSDSMEVLRRPAWTYPLLWTAYTLFLLALCAALTRHIGLVTGVALLYGVVRLGVLWFDREVLDYAGVVAYPLVVPAVVFDLGLAYLAPRWGRRHKRRLALVGLVVAGVVVSTTPRYWAWLAVAPALNVLPWREYWLLALGAGVLGTLGGWRCGGWLRGLRPVAEGDAERPRVDTRQWQEQGSVVR